jgi:hypothetical protein
MNQTDHFGKWLELTTWKTAGTDQLENCCNRPHGKCSNFPSTTWKWEGIDHLENIWSWPPRKFHKLITFSIAGDDHLYRVGLTWDMLQGCSWRIACWPPRTCRASCRRRVSLLFSPHPHMSFRARKLKGQCHEIFCFRVFHSSSKKLWKVNTNSNILRILILLLPSFWVTLPKYCLKIRNGVPVTLYFSNVCRSVLQQNWNSSSWNEWPSLVKLR